MRIKLEATSVGIGTEKPLSGLVLKNLPLRSAILNFFRAYLVPGQLVNPDYATALVDYVIACVEFGKNTDYAPTPLIVFSDVATIRKLNSSL